MAKTYKSKKAKGKRLEQEIASLLRTKGLDKNARRMPMSGAIEGFKTDIFTSLDIAIECKNQERLQLWAAWEQAKRQATGLKMPVLFVSGNYRPTLAIMDVNDWANIYKEYRESYL